ncbi:major facilitator superfamily domain-containing protein [Xylaria digitata]|nr:major facilitator superfamily domain-containing protein [Xylaria digitata]
MLTSDPEIPRLGQFLRPLDIDGTKAWTLAHELARTFRRLAFESSEQFLPTPISESILRPTGGRERGRGGTNLRVGFIELYGSKSAPTSNGATLNGNHSDHRTPSNLRRVLEKIWPIQESLKNNENPDPLFAWIGSCIAQVVKQGVKDFSLDRNKELPMGVTFSFPIAQNTLSNATIMAMGKGFAMTPKLDLGTLLVNGYEKSKPSDLPPIKVTAILNDAVATLVSFIYQFPEDRNHKAAMGFICGTGTNATILMRQSALSLEKLPEQITVGVGDPLEDIKVAVNTEWSIKGSAEPLRLLGERPGFQPFEYMTSGRYLGELARLILVDYMKSHFALSDDNIPAGKYNSTDPSILLRKLRSEFPLTTSRQPFEWTVDGAMALYHIAKAIQVRAAALIAAAVIGLLACAGDLPWPAPWPAPSSPDSSEETTGKKDKVNLVVGYTGGCIDHFHNYLLDCQWFMDEIMETEFGSRTPARPILSPCYDGGITGAGILCGVSQAKAKELVVQRTMAKEHGHDDQQNERTALLQPEQPTRYETIATIATATSAERLEDAGEADAERDSLLARSGAGENNPAPSAPGPLKPVPPEGEGGDDDLEASGVSPPRGANDDGESPSFLIHTHPRRFRVVFAGIMLTYSIANFDSTIMASSHPVITSHFHASNMASWLTTAFLLTSTAFQPLVGRLSDTIGRKPLYLATMVVFAGATAWCALAQSITSFIAARAVCGLGAGGMMTLGAISISDCVPIEQRGTYQSIINVVYGLAAASGAAFGGLLADTLGWRWEFGIQLVPIALCLATAAFSMPGDLGLQSGHKKQTLVQALRGFDFTGSVLLTTATTFLILGLVNADAFPGSHPFIISSLAIFAACFPTCLYVESRAARPIMPLVLLHSTPRANIIFSNFLASFLLNAILFNAPLFFRAVLLKSATQSGLYLVVPTAAASLTGAITGVLITRTGRLKWPLLSGATLYLLGTVLLSAMSRAWPVWVCILGLVPAAVGQGFQFPGTFIAVLAASTQREQAVVTSTLQLWRSLGSVLGVACSSLVFQNALLLYLVTYVTVPDGPGGQEWKRRFIERVRSSIEAVAELPDSIAKDQVIVSYAAACRAAFLVCLGIALVSVLLILPIRLPRLGRK